MEGLPRLKDKLEAGVMREPVFGPIALDLENKTVKSVDTNQAERLSDQEYQILWLLVRSQGAILSKSEIEEFLYEDMSDDKDLPLGNTLDVHLNSLRNKLKTLVGEKISIQNLRNIGWKLSVD